MGAELWVPGLRAGHRCVYCRSLPLRGRAWVARVYLCPRCVRMDIRVVKEVGAGRGGSVSVCVCVGVEGVCACTACLASGPAGRERTLGLGCDRGGCHTLQLHFPQPGRRARDKPISTGGRGGGGGVQGVFRG